MEEIEVEVEVARSHSQTETEDGEEEDELIRMRNNAIWCKATQVDTMLLIG